MRSLDNEILNNRSDVSDFGSVTVRCGLAGFLALGVEYGQCGLFWVTIVFVSIAVPKSKASIVVPMGKKQSSNISRQSIMYNFPNAVGRIQPFPFKKHAVKIPEKW
jgi:hypothetical protein